MSKSVVLLLTVTALAFGQEAKEPSLFGQHAGPPAPNAAFFSLDWAQQAATAEAHGASAVWRAEHPGWTIAFDERTGMPWRAFGPGIQVASNGAKQDEIEAVAHTLRDALAPVAGVDAASFKFVTAQVAGRLWYVDFAQTVSGAPVWNGGMTMRIDREGRLVMWGGRFVDGRLVADAPSIGANEAIAETFAHLARERVVGADTRYERPDAKLVVHVAESRDSKIPTLAWLVDLETTAPFGSWKVFVDATNRSILEYWNDNREEHAHEHEHEVGGGGDEEMLSFDERMRNPLFMEPILATFSGTSTGTVHDGVLPQAAPVLRNFNDLYVNCNGTNVLTDALGFYTFNGGGATVPVSSLLDGNHVTTNNSASGGLQATFTATGSAGTLDVTWTDLNSLLAERDVFFFTNQAWHNVFLRNPSETNFQNAIPANVNVSGTCNAFYSPGQQTINFYPAGGGCINTAYSASVVIHEFGHHVTTRIYVQHGSSIPGGMGEGFADCQSGAVLDSNIVGDGWQGPGTMVRNLNNTCQWFASCGTEVHAYGMIIGACYWHTRNHFSAAYGAAGKVMIDEYLYQHFHGTPMNEIESCMEMMLLNDTDANIANGTPDADKFYAGYTVQHSVPFPVPVVAITHDQIRDTMDQLQNYQVHASGVPYFAGGLSSATTFYSVNGGAFIGLAMANVGGNDFFASIPVQPFGSVVRYYLEFQDSGGRVQKLPAAGGNQPFSFLTSRRSQFFFDGFEVASGWVHTLVAVQDDWQNGAPGNPNHAYDPGSAYEGTKCWGNDLSIGNFNGNYQNNVNNNLTSPSINCTGQTGVVLVYRRWLTIEDGVFDHARILVSNNNGLSYSIVWQNLTGANTIDTAWFEHTVDISAFADNQPNVKIRYELVTDPGLVFGGWSIDAFSLASSSAVLPLASIGSNAPGGLATIRTTGLQGDAVILAVDVATSANYYAGIGTLSLNVGSPSILLVYDGSQIVPPSGVIDLSFIVPAASGLTAYFEGILLPTTAPPILITNVLPFTIL